MSTDSNTNDTNDTSNDTRSPESFNALPSLFKHISEEQYNNEIAADAAKYAIPGLTRHSGKDDTTTFNPDANKFIDYAVAPVVEAKAWSNYASADYADYSTYHPDDLNQIKEFGEYLSKTLPSEFRSASNRIFEAKGLRVLEDSEFPAMPEDNDAILGWVCKWLRRNSFMSDFASLAESVAKGTLDVKLLNSKADDVRIRAIHGQIIRKARDDKDTADKVPAGHCYTSGFYEDPAINERLSIPPQASQATKELLELKNEHRDKLANSAYRADYIRNYGVICHCCGTPNEAASGWPKGGSKMKAYHSGNAAYLCRGCRNTLATVLNGIGTYHMLPDGIKEFIANLKGANNGVVTPADIGAPVQLALYLGIEKAKELAHQEAKKKAPSSIAELKSLMLGAFQKPK